MQQILWMLLAHCGRKNSDLGVLSAAQRQHIQTLAYSFPIISTSFQEANLRNV
jgi:hypothetical protein